MPNEPRKRGRPKGEPKPKEPSRMGRPSEVWGEYRTIKRGVTAPELFFEALKNPEMKKRIWELILDFAAPKCDNKRVESSGGDGLQEDGDTEMKITPLDCHYGDCFEREDGSSHHNSYHPTENRGGFGWDEPAPYWMQDDYKNKTGYWAPNPNPPKLTGTGKSGRPRRNEPRN